MKRIYYLSTCKTCMRVIDELDGLDDFEHRDIKEKNIEPEVLDHAARIVGSYEGLFSRRARKYRSMGLADRDLGEQDYRQLILDEYTFLKRPVIIYGDHVFAGHAKKEIEGAREAISGD